MLSRNAQGLYWIGRYIERAQQGCRLLANQLEALEDRPVDEIDRTWRRLYAGFCGEPLVGELGHSWGSEEFMLADAYTLAHDLTFEPRNPNSIRACVGAARENARQVRNVISRDMWSCLNIAYLGLRPIEIENIWNDRPVEFYSRTEDAIRTFSGIVESTLYRDEGWHFILLGRFVERAQLVAALVDAQLEVFPTGDLHVESDWRSLLQICEARVAYSRLYSLAYEPGTVVDFLVSDARLSRSIRYALAQIQGSLDAVTAQGKLPEALEARRRASRMAARIDDDWPARNSTNDDATRTMLQQIWNSCGRLNEDIEATYFDYEVEDTTGS